MKKLFVLLAIVLIPSLAMAGIRFCQWNNDDKQPFACQTVVRVNGQHQITLPDGTVVTTVQAANDAGLYRLRFVAPTIGENQKRGDKTYSLMGNEITMTYEVIDLTQEEIDAITAQVMDMNIYYLWKLLMETGVITVQQALDNVPQEVIDAYQARKRLESSQ